MQAWKIGIFSVPAVAGFALGAKHIVQANSKNSALPKIDVVVPPRVSEQTNSQDKLHSEPQLEPNLIPKFNVKVQLNSGTQVKSILGKSAPRVAQKIDFSKPIFNKLHDYTFKLITPCSEGTGWILDYQLPKNSQNYPTVWYIATAAHVVNNWYFEKKNSYQRDLPTICKTSSSGQFYLELARRDEEDTLKQGLKSPKKQRVKSHKLFWTALDLFEPNSDLGITDNNYKDFAVFEVTFESEQISKEITRDFANKYKVDSGDLLDVFGDALVPVKSQEKNNSKFYSLGYPRNDEDELFLKSNWGEKGEKGDTLSNDSQKQYKIANKDKVRGFLSANHINDRIQAFKWGKKRYNEFGHFYYMNGTKLGKGASGSMIVDESGKVLGVRSLENNYSLYTPLRSGKLDLREIKTPEYDLISGATGQKSSYREEVVKHLLSKNKETWLSRIRSWKPTLQART